ncbi:hypothetical protein DL766_001398 [Monosporascus sp. MC13-8B]|uniref:Tesmin/TSO1-like CXC domain-containing protein n=1 Tax=Monosporascus cannonballus TaxID=155416 RepID=A0ABY0HH38_9PEZI|nr:hypothetical protein DL762_001227 [Monosporascus cannonballus]RYO98874.1 hypothetical protein DL763_001917 [Monosporascus cannonballus]RYP37749.1 hypothetical protein DL766_001398 [Monosporascus sp. MC13-8B]
MSFPPAKRQRSNTSRDFANNAPQTAAPGLRQHPQLQVQENPIPALYTAAAAYGNDHGGYNPQSPVRQAVDYTSAYPPPNAVTTAQPKGYTTAYHPQAHATPSTGYEGSYSPQLQTRNHDYATAQYQQQQGYSQPGLNGSHTHNGYTRALQTEVLRAYSPTPHSNPQTTGHGQAQPQNSFVQYGETYTPQPAAHLPSYRGSATPYPDPTINPQYSPPPVPPPHQQSPPNGNGQVPEDSGGNDSEDAMGEAADDPTEFYQKPEPSSSTSPNLSEHPPETRCACKKGRGKKKACSSCQCTKYGRACSSQCACGNACGNPFADLTMFFGPPETFTKPCGANPCFATWLSNQPNIEELDIDLMVDMMLYDDTSWASIRSYTPAFAKWEASWSRARNGKGKKSREERERLEFELLRGGLGNCNQNDFNGFWYSFCKSGWVLTDDWEHCQECRQCKPSMEWHCEKHEQCTTNRMCPGCHGNPTYPDMMAYAEAAGHL